jgi:hypothetical protein
MPAAVTRLRRGPISIAVSQAWMTCSGFVTSTFTNAPPMSLATALPLSSWRSAMTTLAPREARRRAVASPRPEAPPVTIDEVPLRSRAIGSRT